MNKFYHDDEDEDDDDIFEEASMLNSYKNYREESDQRKLDWIGIWEDDLTLTNSYCDLNGSVVFRYK